MTPAAAVSRAFTSKPTSGHFPQWQEVAERENMQQFFYQPRYEWFIFIPFTFLMLYLERLHNTPQLPLVVSEPL